MYAPYVPDRPKVKEHFTRVCVPKKRVERFEESDAADGFTFVPNTDMGGYDIMCDSSGISVDKVREKCLADSQCMGYNYVRANGPWGASSGGCTKYTNSAPTGDNAGVDSYIRSDDVADGFTKVINSDVPGNDIMCDSNNVPVSKCRDQCANDPNCQAYNYVKKKGPWGDKSGCCLKSSQANVTPNSGGVDLYVRNQ